MDKIQAQPTPLRQSVGMGEAYLPVLSAAFAGRAGWGRAGLSWDREIARLVGRVRLSAFLPPTTRPSEPLAGVTD
jgi:hypothetical protein